ncbi:MAG: HesA/MoeB/ThiF family protein [Desulfitobacteriaceae bacterium]
MSSFPERYRRNAQTISPANQDKLKASTVAVIGCGGLGGYIAEELARLGVGHLILIDGDKVEASNLNRQLFATEKAVGTPKVEAARARLQEVNSEVKLDLFQDWFKEEKAETFLAGADLVCDALDSISVRLELERGCHALNLPLVFAGIAGWYGLVGVSFPGDRSMAHLFGQGERGVETVLGNPPFTPAVVASLAVAEAVKVLTGKESVLRKAWLQIDLLAMEFEKFTIE